MFCALTQPIQINKIARVSVQPGLSKMNANKKKKISMLRRLKVVTNQVTPYRYCIGTTFTDLL